jgi:hypothetical protein
LLAGLAALAISAPALAAIDPPAPGGAHSASVLSESSPPAAREGAPMAVFDPLRRETRVQGLVPGPSPGTPDGSACVDLRLPGTWRAVPEGGLVRLSADDASLELELSAAAPGRDGGAEGLRRDYEALLGRPAQALTVSPTDLPGVSRVQATWTDGAFDNPGRSFDLDAFLVETPRAGLLTLTVQDASNAPRPDPRLAGALRTLRVTPAASCGSRAAGR